MKKRWLVVLCCLLLLAGCATKPAAETKKDGAIALQVNGEAVYETAVQEVITLLEETYNEYELAQEDYPSDEEIREQAIEQVVRDTVVRQYIRELGLDEISDREAEVIREAADSAWNSKVDAYISNYSTFLSEDADDTAFRKVAEGYFAAQGYTYDRLLAEMEDYCRAQHLYNYLMDGIEVSEDAVAEHYEERLQEDEEYAKDIALYEQMMYVSKRTMLYTPAGYRGVLQILLPVDNTLLLAYTSAETEEEASEVENEILTQHQSVTDEIYKALEGGAAFSDLVEQYGSDQGMLDYLEDGYPVHAQSVIFPDEFIAQSMKLNKTGDYSQPFMTTNGIHIVYYLRDVPSGKTALTEEVKVLLSGELMDERVSEKYTELADRLYAEAVIKR